MKKQFFDNTRHNDEPEWGVTTAAPVDFGLIFLAALAAGIVASALWYGLAAPGVPAEKAGGTLFILSLLFIFSLVARLEKRR